METEYLTHLVYECAVVRDVLVKLNDKINATLQQNGHEHVHLDLRNVILGFEIQSDRIRIYLNTILQIVKWKVWKIRNLIKYEYKFFSVTPILKSVLSKIASCSKFLKATTVSRKYNAVLDLLGQL